VRVGECPSCGGAAVFRRVDGEDIGACAVDSRRRCWWTT
jgi:hypothetical protein